MTKRCAVLFLIILFCNALPASARDEHMFPRPAELEDAVQFWTRVYTEISTSEGFIHDDTDLGVIYEKIRLPEGASHRTRERYVKNIKRKYEAILRTLASGKRSGLSSEEQRVLSLWPKDVSNKQLHRATDQIRFQLGQSDKFRAGLLRSGAWKPYIVKTLKDMGLPTEISALPHVESSFNYKAYSKVGAAGMWQFTRSTGRRFMRVDHIIDERMDPLKATIAAGQLLENNYAVTGSWPLAITAYNHGAAGMRRAAIQLGTTDIVSVIRHYRSRSFGFASRNFYTAFLAAVEIDSNPEKYFGKLELYPPVDYELIEIPAFINANTLIKVLNISREDLMETNPALRPAIWQGNKYIPKGYELRINRKLYPDTESAKQAIAQLGSENMYAKQKPDRYHRVRRGQTLSNIAARYGVHINDLVALNNLHSRHTIRVGQLLRLPQRGKRIQGKTIMVAEKGPAKVEPSAIPASGTYRVRRGDSVASIARRYGLSTGELLAYNRLHNSNRIYPGQRLMLAKAETGDIHVVRRGDTIDRIAKRYGKSPGELLALNNLRNKNRIYPGQKLLLAKVDTEKVSLTSTSAKTQIDASEVADDADTNAADENADDQSQQIAMNTDADSNDSQTSGNENDEQASKDQDKSTDEQSLSSVLGVTRDESVPLPTDSDSEVDSNDNPFLGETNTGSNDNVAKISNAVPIGDKDSSDSDTNPSDSSESLADTVMSESQTEDNSALLADPTDYSVAKNNTIEVQAAETLGHYAEWLQLRASQLRRVNRMRYRKPVVIGKHIKLIFSKVTPQEFEEQRIAYHRSLQEDFFEQYQITGADKHKIRRGQSVWKLAKHKYKIPIWLLRQYNPDLDMDKVRPGNIVTFPKIEERSDENLKDDQPANPTKADANRKANTKT